jgi:hypothetical protein
MPICIGFLRLTTWGKTPKRNSEENATTISGVNYTHRTQLLVEKWHWRVQRRILDENSLSICDASK